ncbi:MAG: nuclear export factor [Ilumatobacteraceae bacterium]|nr:nuclear export factor [Ilumatobacteraceae bacterium]
MLRTARRTAGLAIVATCVAVLAGVGVAAAHIQTDPPAIEAGKQATLGFIVEHGCGDANTTGLDIQLPDGVTDATAAEDGWQVTTDGGAVRFSGGNQDAHTSETFHITFTAPATPGIATFPTVQRCGATETAWLDVPVEGQPEPEHPAPQVKLTQGPPTSDDLVIAPDDGTDAGATGTSDAGGSATTASSTPAITVAPAVTTAPATSNDDSNTAGIVIAVIFGAAVLLAIAGTVVTLRNRRKGQPPSTPPGTPGNTAS